MRTYTTAHSPHALVLLENAFIFVGTDGPPSARPVFLPTFSSQSPSNLWHKLPPGFLGQGRLLQQRRANNQKKL